MDQMPVYVKIINIKEIKELITSLRDKINQAKECMQRIGSLSEEESAKVEQWKSHFESVNNNINSINNALLKPERI